MSILTSICLFGQIKNGYESEIHGMRSSLESLNRLLAEECNLSVFQRSDINRKIRMLVEYIAYFKLTEELLTQFRSISPDLYEEINIIKDCSGHRIAVYVKFVPEKEMQYSAGGTTNIGHLENNTNVYDSEYGHYSVSVRIASVNRALILLAHEFGHVKYQVPNLASYVLFYAATYQQRPVSSSYIGHNTHDPSGKEAIAVENRFRKSYLNFLDENSVHLENPLARLQKIHKTVGKEQKSMTLVQ